MIIFQMNEANFCFFTKRDTFVIFPYFDCLLNEMCITCMPAASNDA